MFWTNSETNLRRPPKGGSFIGHIMNTYLKSKLHGATVTHSELHYDGSVAIDETLLNLADIAEFEQLDVYNVTNGERWTTYALKAEPNSGIISVNGAGARLCQVGDTVIICCYEIGSMPFAMPKLIYLTGENKIDRVTNTIDKQMSDVV